MSKSDPLCPKCRERLVFVVMVISGEMFKTWQCDCEYRNEDENIIPDGMIADIMRAREWDEGSVCVSFDGMV